MADLVVHAMGESITEAIIGRWLKSVGDYVEADEPVVDLETDKINVEIPAPTAGVLKEQRYSEGDTVRVGDVVGLIEEGARPEDGVAARKKVAGKKKPARKETAKKEPAKKREAKPAPEEAEEAEEPEDRAPETEPAEAGRQVPERDERGRLLSPAMRRARREGKAKAAPAPAAPARPSATPTPTTTSEREEVVPMSPLRKRIAERLVEAQQSSASLTTFNEVDLTEVMALRKRFRDSFVEEHGIKLGFMSFFVKASVAALQRFPGLNAEVEGDSIVYKKFYDIGIAVGTDRGLVVPVLRDADRLSFAEIEQGIIDLATKAKDRKLVLEDLTGATFTITNGGIYGSMMSTPLLNFPQTGILGMHNIALRPVVIDGKIEIRPMMYLAVTYDHRVVDGKEAVQFLVAIKERLEHPERLLLQV
jgi:2-oxoglutarate dehydrogenase E2 component (dihydrolipoamide succinyltransferase)